MCQWKFFVFRYSAKVSASNALSSAERSRVASAPRSLVVCSGAVRRCFAALRLVFGLAVLILAVLIGVRSLNYADSILTGGRAFFAFTAAAASARPAPAARESRDGVAYSPQRSSIAESRLGALPGPRPTPPARVAYRCPDRVAPPAPACG